MELEAKLKKGFGGQFLLDVSFNLSASRTGIFGPSGSGKSTIMSLLSGLAVADSGYIRMGEKVLFDSERKINLKPERRGIGIVFQHAHLFPHMSVKRNVLYGYKRAKMENRRIEPEALFDILGVTPLLTRNVTTLSGGERQRIALARTVLSCPELIMMDEPLSALDEGNKFQIIPYLKRVSSEFGIPLLFISHSVLEMRMMTEEVLVVSEGKIKSHSATEDLAKKSWADGQEGYVNLLNFGKPDHSNGLFYYPWGKTHLVLTEPGDSEENLFELDSREIILFKRNPEATSARNLFECTVKNIYESERRVRVELASGEDRLVAQIVPESLREMNIEIGSKVVAAIKASAFKKIF